MQHSFVAPNINFETPDEDSARLNIAAEKPRNRLLTPFCRILLGSGVLIPSIIITKFCRQLTTDFS